MFSFRSIRWQIVAVGCAMLTVRSFAANPTIDRVRGDSHFTVEGPITDLSGLAWAGGDSFFAVSDKRPAVLPVTLRIDRASGAISSGEFGAPIPVPTKRADFEGVVYASATRRFYIATERPPGVISFRAGEPAVRQWPLPRIFARARLGLALESITWDAGSRRFWIANEEALAVDGPVADANAGTFVRLMQLDSVLKPLAQYAWRTEPATMRYGAGCGVADLLLLPDGTLLVLERGFAGLGLAVRIYAASTAGATDVSRLASLEGAKFSPAGKTLLYREQTGLLNFEGMALGPELADGSRSLVLVADSHGGTRHVFMALKLRLRAATP